MRRIGSFIVLAALLAGSAAAQSTVWSGTARGFHAFVGPRLIVRDKGGDLYTLYRYQPSSLTEWRLGVAQSTDGGKSWNLGWQTGFDSNTSGYPGNVPNGLAIDSQENLHAVWYNSETTRNWATPRYNRYDRATKTWGTEVMLVGSGYGRSAVAVAVDSSDYVWIVRAVGSWTATVERSDKPFASDMKFSATTPAFPTRNVQKASLAVDALDRVHVTFYATSNGATVHHMWLDPSATTPAWSSATPLGNNNGTSDYWSSIVADNAGNTYCVYGVDDQNGKTPDPFWELRKWDGTTQTWGSPVPIYKTTRSAWEPVSGQYNDGRVICAACDEKSGELYFTYRNLETGKFLLGRWADGDANPTIFAELCDTGALPANSRNYMLFPNFRGTVTPAFNQTSIGLNLFYVLGDQTATSPVYTWYCDTYPLGSLTPAPSSTPKIGTTFKMDLTALTDGGKGYITALSVTGLGTSIRPDRRYIPILPDAFFYITAKNTIPSVFQNFWGAFGSQGIAQAAIVIPNISSLVGIKAYTSFVTYPGGAKGIRTISNPLTFLILP